MNNPDFTGAKFIAHQGDALLIIDVQNDFLPGGALAVRQGDSIIPALNHCIELFRERELPIFATRDWHPPNHCSFLPQGGPWPVHCVADSTGAAFASTLNLPESVRIISKADNAEMEAYSGFSHTNLGYLLRGHGITRLLVGGLATDYCVLNTVKDALSARFEVYLLRDAIRAVDVNAGDGAHALSEMLRLGAQLIELADIS